MPAFVRLSPAPLMTPPTVRVLALTVTVRLAFIVTAPVPRFKLFVPAKVKLPFQFCALLVNKVTLAPLVLSRLPPLMTKVAAVAPMGPAVALPPPLMASVPELSVVVPV